MCVVARAKLDRARPRRVDVHEAVPAAVEDILRVVPATGAIVCGWLRRAVSEAWLSSDSKWTADARRRLSGRTVVDALAGAARVVAGLVLVRVIVLGRVDALLARARPVVAERLQQEVPLDRRVGLRAKRVNAASVTATRRRVLHAVCYTRCYTRCCTRCNNAAD